MELTEAEDIKKRWQEYTEELYRKDLQVSSVAQSRPTLGNPRTAVCQASLSIISSQSLLKLMIIESVVASNHLILCRPLLLLPTIFPSIWGFSNESVLHIRLPRYWSFSLPSILPMNIQDWFPLGLTGSPCSPRNSQESSPTPQFKSISSSVLSFLHSPTLTSIHDHRENHSLD